MIDNYKPPTSTYTFSIYSAEDVYKIHRIISANNLANALSDVLDMIHKYWDGNYDLEGISSESLIDTIKEKAELITRDYGITQALLDE